jgi:hypothetical protein
MAKAKCKGFLADEDGEVIEVDGINHHVLFQVTSVDREKGVITLSYVEHGEPDVPDAGDVLQATWFEIEEEPEEEPPPQVVHAFDKGGGP